MARKLTIRKAKVTLMKSTLIILGSVLFCFCATVWAQSDRGTLTGTVTDPSGGVVPQAAVVAKESSTGIERRVTTTGTGDFTISSLPAGTYDLTVTANGFKEYVQTGITIQVAQTAALNVVMQVGTQTQTVTVNANAPLLRTEDAEQSTTVSRSFLNELPINYAANGALRDALAFSKLTPGVFSAGSANFMGGMVVNGLQESSFKIIVEGQDATSGNVVDQFYGALRPSIDMMQEFTVEGSNFNAEYGQVSGGLFNFTARSGTNQLHGSAYEYWVNEVLNAAQPFTWNDATNSNTRTKNRQNDYGFTVGGPVYIPKLYDGRNKTFFFFNLEQYRQKNAGLVTLTVPTADMRDGNFSEILTGRQLGTDALGRPIMENAIYDPTTARVVNGQVVTDPFSGNIIPTGRLDAAAGKIQSFIPTANLSGLVANYRVPAPFPTTNTVPAFKIDQVISEKLRMSFYMSYFGSNTFYAEDGLPNPITTNRVGQPHSYTYRYNADYTATPTLYLHLGLGWLQERDLDSGLNATYNPSQLGMPVVSSLGFPEINIAGSSYGGFSNGASSYSMGTRAQSLYYSSKLTGNLGATWVHGKHTYKAGVEYKNDGWIMHQNQYAMGYYNFAGNETGLPYLATTTVSGAEATGQIGFPYASFLLGGVDGGTVSNTAINQFHHPYEALYVQDTWKVTPRFTLDYGLRWEHTSVLHERFYRTSGFDGTEANPSAGGLPGAMAYEGFGTGRCNCNWQKGYPYAFGPRLGGAYKLTPKTVLRGGWGLVYGGSTTTDYYGANTHAVGVGFNTINFNAPTFGTANTTLENGFNFTQAQLNSASLDPGIVPTAGSISDFPSPWWDPQGARPSRINTWNLSVQREITPRLVAEVAYVGNRGVWELSGDSSNLLLNQINAVSFQRLQSFGLNPASAADQTLLTSTFASGAPQAAGFQVPYAGFPTGYTLAQALRPYPQFGNIFSMFSPLGKSWYDALQSKLTTRFSHGLQMLTTFTWAKSFLEGGDYRGRYVPINDSFSKANNKDLSPEDIPFMLSIAFTYQIPTPAALHSNRFTRGVFGGWQLGGIEGIQSGNPIQAPGSNNNLSNLTFESTNVDKVPGVSPYLINPNSHFDPNTASVLNPAAWVDVPQGTWGTAAAFYNNYRSQRTHDEEANLQKTFKLGERVNFQVRLEFFNLFNRVSLAYWALQSYNIAVPQSVPVNGFGNTTGAYANAPRTGQLVGRITF